MSGLVRKGEVMTLVVVLDDGTPVEVVDDVRER